MKPENIAYAARVNAAYWLIRKARKIARRLADTTSEQQQAIEYEIVEIGMLLYKDATQESEAEATHDSHARAKARFEFGDESERDAYVAGVVDQLEETTYDPGEDHELEAYVAAVRELVPDADRLTIEQYRKNHGISPEETAKRWQIWKQLQE